MLKDVEVEAENRRKERNIKRLQAAELSAPAAELSSDSSKAPAGGRKVGIAAKFLLNLQTKAVEDAEQVVDDDDEHDDDKLDLDSARTRPTSVLELFRELVRQQEAHKVEDELRAQVSEQRAAKLEEAQQKEAAEDQDGDEANDDEKERPEEPAKLLSQKSMKTIDAVAGSGAAASKLPADVVFLENQD